MKSLIIKAILLLIVGIGCCVIGMTSENPLNKALLVVSGADLGIAIFGIAIILNYYKHGNNTGVIGADKQEC